MIQFTKDFCKKDICYLWHVTFGDDFEYIEYVYGVFEKHGRFYGLFDGKTLVSMMLVLDLPLNFYGQVQKSAYMYYRLRKIMTISLILFNSDWKRVMTISKKSDSYLKMREIMAIPLPSLTEPGS